MSNTQCALLGLASWHVLVLFLLAGFRLYTSITQKKAANTFAADGSDVPGFGQRLVRVHANCYENIPLFLALLMVEAADLVFAVDSVPAIFAITTDPFIVYTSNIFAILGLRALYFLVAGVAGRLQLLTDGLAMVLTCVGTKMLIAPWYHVPVAASLAIVAVLIGASVIASLLATRDRPAA